MKPGLWLFGALGLAPYAAVHLVSANASVSAAPDAVVHLVFANTSVSLLSAAPSGQHSVHTQEPPFLSTHASVSACPSDQHSTDTPIPASSPTFKLPTEQEMMNEAKSVWSAIVAGNRSAVSHLPALLKEETKTAIVRMIAAQYKEQREFENFSKALIHGQKLLIDRVAWESTVKSFLDIYVRALNSQRLRQSRNMFFLTSINTARSILGMIYDVDHTQMSQETRLDMRKSVGILVHDYLEKLRFQASPYKPRQTTTDEDRAKASLRSREQYIELVVEGVLAGQPEVYELVDGDVIKIVTANEQADKNHFMNHYANRMDEASTKKSEETISYILAKPQDKTEELDHKSQHETGKLDHSLQNEKESLDDSREPKAVEKEKEDRHKLLIAGLVHGLAGPAVLGGIGYGAYKAWHNLNGLREIMKAAQLAREGGNMLGGTIGALRGAGVFTEQALSSTRNFLGAGQSLVNGAAKAIQATGPVAAEAAAANLGALPVAAQIPAETLMNLNEDLAYISAERVALLRNVATTAANTLGMTAESTEALVEQTYAVEEAVMQLGADAIGEVGHLGVEAVHASWETAAAAMRPFTAWDPWVASQVAPAIASAPAHYIQSAAALAGETASFVESSRTSAVGSVIHRPWLKVTKAGSSVGSSAASIAETVSHAPGQITAWAGNTVAALEGVLAGAQPVAQQGSEQAINIASSVSTEVLNAAGSTVAHGADLTEEAVSGIAHAGHDIFSWLFSSATNLPAGVANGISNSIAQASEAAFDSIDSSGSPEFSESVDWEYSPPSECSWFNDDSLPEMEDEVEKIAKVLMNRRILDEGIPFKHKLSLYKEQLENFKNQHPEWKQKPESDISDLDISDSKENGKEHDWNEEKSGDGPASTGTDTWGPQPQTNFQSAQRYTTALANNGKSAITPSPTNTAGQDSGTSTQSSVPSSSTTVSVLSSGGITSSSFIVLSATNAPKSVTSLSSLVSTPTSARTPTIASTVSSSPLSSSVSTVPETKTSSTITPAPFDISTTSSSLSSTISSTPSRPRKIVTIYPTSAINPMRISTVILPAPTPSTSSPRPNQLETITLTIKTSTRITGVLVTLLPNGVWV